MHMLATCIIYIQEDTPMKVLMYSTAFRLEEGTNGSACKYTQIGPQTVKVALVMQSTLMKHMLLCSINTRIPYKKHQAPPTIILLNASSSSDR